MTDQELVQMTLRKGNEAAKRLCGFEPERPKSMAEFYYGFGGQRRQLEEDQKPVRMAQCWHARCAGCGKGPFSHPIRWDVKSLDKFEGEVLCGDCERRKQNG